MEDFLAKGDSTSGGPVMGGIIIHVLCSLHMRSSSKPLKLGLLIIVSFPNHEAWLKVATPFTKPNRGWSLACETSTIVGFLVYVIRYSDSVLQLRWKIIFPFLAS